MGWYTDYVKKPARKAGGWAKRNAGKIARETAVVGAGIGGSFIPFCGPACGAVAAYAVDEWLGDPIERNTSRAIDRAGAESRDFVDYIRGQGPKVPRPTELPTVVEGTADVTTVSGEAKKEADYTIPVAIATGLVVTTALAVLVLHQTGRLPWRA